jgi:MoaA/NifB/PqqE/SkfB family radical SAM enzyme
MLSKFFRKKLGNEKRDPSKTDFCYYPFFQVLLSADGKYMPCSHHTGFITENGKEIRANTHSIEEAWNSEYMHTLRENFKKNIRHEGCVQCWKEQSIGLKPMRYDSYGYDIPESQVECPKIPMRVEINASNICNLKCRICWSHASSKWIKEAKDVYNVESEVHYNMNSENQEIIRRWVPNFTQIGFFGGEPLMSEENIELMRYCVETGYSKNISLLINTNTTYYTDELAALFKQFKNLYLNFSIDDIESRFEYQRNGANWNLVVENLKKFTALGGYSGDSQIQCKICCSVTTYNIYYFPEYFNFFNEHFPGMPVFWNLVYMPWQLSISLLPKDVKKIIAERLKNYVSTTYKMDELRTKTIDSLITFLNAHDNRDFSEFFRHTWRHDKYRNECFKETFPELYKIIKEYAPLDCMK